MKDTNEKPPIIPDGYIEVQRGDERAGDLAYNDLSREWKEIPDFILVLGEYLPFRYPAIRKVEETKL